MVPLLYDDLIQKAAFTWISCPNERSPAAGLCEHIRRKISPTKPASPSTRSEGRVSFLLYLSAINSKKNRDIILLCYQGTQGRRHIVPTVISYPFCVNYFLPAA